MDSQPTIPMDLPPPLPSPPTPPPPTTAITTVATSDQISNHIAQVANPTPNHAPSPNHPPYAEMITAAVTALKEKNGSSKTAIAKYIDRVYTNLPAAHSALLTYHLKRLKTNGQLITVKHSYKLPSSPRSTPFPDNAADSPTPLGQSRKRGRPPKTKPNSLPPVQPVQPIQSVQAQVYEDGLAYQAHPAHQTHQTHQTQPFVTHVGPAESYNIGLGPGLTQNLYNVAVGPSPVSQKRKPGRPPKIKTGDSHVAQNNTTADSPAAHYVVVPPPPAVDVAHNSTLPPPSVAAAAQSNGAIYGPEAVFVSLGLADGPPSVRRRGRPRKVDFGGPQQPKPNPNPRPLNQSNRPKRKPGRPAKNGLVVNGVARAGSILARPRGRPPKRVAPAVINGPVHVQPKKRGRKPKNAQAPGGVVPPAAMFVPHVETSAAVPGTVMVPYAPVFDTVPVARVPPTPLTASGKRRGRPPKTANAPGSAPKKLRNVSGKPLGRPKKKALAADSSQHLAAYLEIKGKLEYLQTTIKQTISVLKPCIENGLPPHALGALEQLEELVTVTVAADDAVVDVQDQQPVQQQV